MSRRHKDKEKENIKAKITPFKLQHMESLEDSHSPKGIHCFEISYDKIKQILSHHFDDDILTNTSFLLDLFGFNTLEVKKLVFKFTLDKEKWAQSMGLLDEIRIDGENVIIPKRLFKTFFELIIPEMPQKEEAKRKGRPKVKQLLSTVADNKVVTFFKDTLKAVKKKCKEMFDGLVQFCVCFLKGIFLVFSPNEDPYGKISHYHRMLVNKIDGIPLRKTLNNNYKWYVEWKEAGVETTKEKAEKKKHRRWEKLIRWIYDHLINLAPEYAFA